MGFTGSVIVIGTSELKESGTIYIDATNGNDSTGTRNDKTKPFATINAGYAQALAGDVIKLSSESHTLIGALALNSDISIVGHHWGSEIIAPNSISATSKNNIEVKNILITCSGATYGLLFTGCRNVLIQNVMVTGATAEGIKIIGSGRCVVDKCQCIANGGSGLWLENNGNITTDPADDRNNTPTLVNLCRFAENQDHGIVAIADHDSVISNCSIERNDKCGIYCFIPAQQLIIGCSIERNGTDNDSGTYKKSQIEIYSGDPATYTPTFTNQSVGIIGNQIRGKRESGTAAQVRAITIQCAVNFNLVVNIQDNYFHGLDNFGISASIDDKCLLNIIGNTCFADAAMTDFVLINTFAGTAISNKNVVVMNNAFHSYGQTVTNGVRIKNVDQVLIKGNYFQGMTNGIQALTSTGSDTTIISDRENTFVGTTNPKLLSGGGGTETITTTNAT